MTIVDNLLEEFNKNFSDQLTNVVSWLSERGITDTLTYHVYGMEVIFKPEDDEEDGMQE